MNLADFKRLRGMMALTASDNDAEALGAIRAANALLVKNGLLWQNVFDRTVTVTTEVEAMPPDEDDAPPFETALRGAAGTFRDTLLSIQAQYEERGWLSARQRQVVDDAADRSDGRVR